MDDTINSKDDELRYDAEAEPKHSMVIVYSKRMEDCPMLRRIGDVIRVTKATLKMHRGTKQFHVRTFHEASWALFSSNPKEEEVKDGNGSDSDKSDSTRTQMAYKFSGKNYQFDHNQDVKPLNELIKFSNDYLVSNCELFFKKCHNVEEI
jgi:hypothetical protein